MKRLLLTIFALFLCSLSTFAKQFQIDRNVTSSDGCNWRIHGTIDVGCCPSIKSYDITIEGPCGKHKFQGMQVNPDGSPSPTTNPSTNMYNMHVYDMNGNEEPITIIDTGFFLAEMLNTYTINQWSWQ